MLLEVGASVVGVGSVVTKVVIGAVGAELVERVAVLAPVVFEPIAAVEPAALVVGVISAVARVVADKVLDVGVAIVETTPAVAAIVVVVVVGFLWGVGCFVD